MTNSETPCLPLLRRWCRRPCWRRGAVRHAGGRPGRNATTPGPPRLCNASARPNGSPSKLCVASCSILGPAGLGSGLGGAATTKGGGGRNPSRLHLAHTAPIRAGLQVWSALCTASSPRAYTVKVRARPRASAEETARRVLKCTTSENTEPQLGPFSHRGTQTVGFTSLNLPGNARHTKFAKGSGQEEEGPQSRGKLKQGGNRQAVQCVPSPAGTSISPQFGQQKWAGTNTAQSFLTGQGARSNRARRAADARPVIISLGGNCVQKKLHDRENDEDDDGGKPVSGLRFGLDFGRLLFAGGRGEGGVFQTSPPFQRRDQAATVLRPHESIPKCRAHGRMGRRGGGALVGLDASAAHLSPRPEPRRYTLKGPKLITANLAHAHSSLAHRGRSSSAQSFTAVIRLSRYSEWRRPADRSSQPRRQIFAVAALALGPKIWLGLLVMTL